ncbi:uncharacterized protein M421DRAFT_104638 [Didymella exigua CBS 183.55]|uniref:CST complex subunit STN1 n=1 Tax=Didymella exigua CBS 183.55 TaxID=1150837 RepID=A0A6A5R6G9_9PLEO|nr:uncharacterized protein M421DRAFT_104638 [Didymella exigua CBS 183.55]KAF1923173.1 hypothetical protein M421DRAFT_104638 [Didymella exigua CBS 183.55]
MSTHPAKRPYRLYPAYCFPYSPTYDAWVRLAAADVHTLWSEPDYQSQNIYFCLNYPVRYVRVVGVVVAIDEITPKYSALTLDDGSGATIELKIVRHVTYQQSSGTLSSTTTISNVNVISQFGAFEIKVDNVNVEIGMILKAKGSISEFRGAKQLELRRVQIVSSTNGEAQAWTENAAFKAEVLSTPWRVTSAEHGEIKAKIRTERKKAKEYERRGREYEIKKAEYEAARAAHDAKKEAKYEARRRREEAMMNAGALI